MKPRTLQQPLSADGSAPYRTDIDGLRALAILLVVVYHVWLGRVSGGVDVFLMISAFFLTASFTRRVASGAKPAVGTYWLRKFRRLLPAAVVTIAGVLVVAYAAYPPSTWPMIWRQSWASLFYVQNWELASSNVDYYARAEVLPSPLQHFWSLSVQGQVFVLWPLIFVVVAFVARRTGIRVEPMLAAVFGVIFASSLAFSIWETSAQQSFAYFDTRTRLWEFAAGSLLALALPHVSLPAAARVVLGWAGIAGIVACGIVLDVQGGFPGYLALWPVMCTAAVIVAGTAPARGAPAALLSSRPLRLLGRDAYALYLVHWPVLITWLVITDRMEVGWLAGSAIIVLSLVLARLIAWGVENPLRRFPRPHAKPALSMVVIAACVAVVAVPLTSWQAWERARAQEQAELYAADYPGATALLPGADPVRSGVPLLPSATDVESDWVVLDGECEGNHAPADEVLAGTCREQRAAFGGRGTVMIVGDSHAQQWGGAVAPIAQDQEWNVIALLKGGCSLAADEPSPGVDDCASWREAALDYIAELRPALVFGMATKTTADTPNEHMLAGLDQTVERIAETGARVVLFRDNPRYTQDMYRCVEENGESSSVCARVRDDVLAAEDPALQLRAPATVLDLSDYVCPDGTCPAIIGNVAVYLDHDHLSGAYAKTLSPILAARLREAGLMAP